MRCSTSIRSASARTCRRSAARMSKGFLQPPADLADAQPAARHDPQGSGGDGDTRAARFYQQGGRAARATSACASCSAISPRPSRAMRTLAVRLGASHPDARRAHAKRKSPHRRFFVLQYVQPGLAGLMDGSVSTLAPLFAAAFATQNNWETFLVGLAASIGAGISMGFAEALSDDGSITGRGSPLLRGGVCGLMTDARRPRPYAALSRAGHASRCTSGSPPASPPSWCSSNCG